jgi:hypothetical protein
MKNKTQKTAKTSGKIEQYGSRKMPLIRSSWMSDAQWAAACLEFDDTMRRMGKKISWQTRNRRCPQCGVDDLSKPKTRFGSCSGLCMKCSDASVKALMAEFGGGR